MNVNCNNAFLKVKEVLMSNQVLTHFNPELPIILSCDASDRSIGIVISHRFEDNSERPISFASRSLTMSERNYSKHIKKL